MSSNSFDLLAEIHPRRVSRVADTPVWPRVRRNTGEPADSTPSMEAPVWPGKPEPGEIEAAPPPTNAPPVPAHLRAATVEPALARQEALPMPPERLEGPAELEFEGIDGDWFREGTMETAAPREEEPEPPSAPTWLLAIPVLASGIMVGMGLMSLLWSLLT